MTSQSPITAPRFCRFFSNLQHYLAVLFVVGLGAALAACGDGGIGPTCTTAECMAICADNPSDPICKPACSTQTSCAAQGKNCGAIADGCGGMVECGSCTSWLTCGGGGTANVCGASCGAGCPSGYSCDPRGVCMGGTPTGLTLDVKTVAVSGKITLNGAVPVASCATASPATVQFQELTQGYTLSIAVPCAPTFEFSGKLYPGNYKVMVLGNTYSNLPLGGAFVARSTLAVTGDQTGLVLDVKKITIDGRVTLNGAPPATTCTSVSPATVTLRELKQGYSFSFPVPCSPSFVWSGSLFPGTYQVTVAGNTSTTFPQGAAYVADPSMTLAQDQTGLALDVKTVAIDGKVTLNGAAPTSTCMTASPATVYLLDVTQGYSLSIPVPCSPTFVWSGTVYPGTYKVAVAGNANSNLPTGSAFVVNPALIVNANQKALNLDVKTVTIDGKVTLNGATPMTSCTSTTMGTVSLREVTQGYSVNLQMPCSPTFTWSGTIYPGTYKVMVSGNSNTNLPGGGFVANSALVVNANQTGVVLDVKTVTIDGRVTVNGSAPDTTCTTTSPANVILREPTLGYSITIPVPCDPLFIWSGTIFPGTYKVSVTGNSSTNIPQGAEFVANAALAVTSNQTGVTLDVKSVAVDGMITLNGMAPTTTCTTSSPASVQFTEITQKYTLTTALQCAPGFAFMSSVFPGTYRVAVLGTQYSNLPQSVPFVAIERLQIP